MKGQSEFARAYRLKQGFCPTHGLQMVLADWWYQPRDGGEPYTVVECVRRDCGSRFKALSHTGPFEPVPPDWAPPDERVGFVGFPLRVLPQPKAKQRKRKCE